MPRPLAYFRRFLATTRNALPARTGLRSLNTRQTLAILFHFHAHTRILPSFPSSLFFFFFLFPFPFSASFTRFLFRNFSFFSPSPPRPRDSFVSTRLAIWSRVLRAREFYEHVYSVFRKKKKKKMYRSIRNGCLIISRGR